MISWMIQCYHLSSSHRRSGTDQLITLPFLSCGFWLFVCLVCFWFWLVCFVVCFVSVFSVGIVTAYWTMYWSYFSSTFAVSITLHVCAWVAGFVGLQDEQNSDGYHGWMYFDSLPYYFFSPPEPLTCGLATRAIRLLTVATIRPAHARPPHPTWVTAVRHIFRCYHPQGKLLFLRACFPQYVTVPVPDGIRDVDVLGFSAGSYTGLAIHKVLNEFDCFPGTTNIAAIHLVGHPGVHFWSFHFKLLWRFCGNCNLLRDAFCYGCCDIDIQDVGMDFCWDRRQSPTLCRHRLGPWCDDWCVIPSQGSCYSWQHRD